jgi:hypothetical protein
MIRAIAQGAKVCKAFGNVPVVRILKVCQIHCSHWSYAQIIFPAGFACQGGLNKDATQWLDGAR